MAVGTFSGIILRPTKTLNVLIKNAITMLLVQGRISEKMWLSLCLLAVLGSHAIVVKYTAGLFAGVDVSVVGIMVKQL